MEESGTLIPQPALQAIPVQSPQLEQPIQLFDGSQRFVHSPQYYWHVAVAKGALAVD